MNFNFSEYLHNVTDRNAYRIFNWKKKKENNRLVLNGKWGSWNTFIQRVSHCNMIKIMRQNKD